MDQVKFVEDKLQKIWRDIVTVASNNTPEL